MEVLDHINAFAWVAGNILLGYTAITLIVFLLSYWIIFDPRATTGGRLIFRFMTSLVGVVIIIFIGIFLDPAPDLDWYVYPPDVEPWRPLGRAVVYAYVAYTVSSLAVLLVLRKWFPDRVQKASDRNLVKVRHTSEIPTIK